MKAGRLCTIALVFVCFVAACDRTSNTASGNVMDAGSDAAAVDAAIPSSTDGGLACPSSAPSVPTPQLITCGASACVLDGGTDVSCCEGTGPGGSSVCVQAELPNRTCAAFQKHNCDEASDCSANQVCCYQFLYSGGATFVTSTCQSSCSFPGAQLCTTDGECPAGSTCSQWKATNGVTLSACGRPAGCP